MQTTNPTEPTENEPILGGDGSERYAEWLGDAPRWLYERAGIDDLSLTEINSLARDELKRRRTDGRITDDAQSVYAWLFVEYALYHDRPRGDGGSGD